MATAVKRGRPPNLTFQPPLRAPTIELESPQPLEPEDDEGLDLADDLDSPSDEEDTDITKSLERLEKLRKSVASNLRLRPIRSSGSLPKVK
jgi:hypothetical protein